MFLVRYVTFSRKPVGTAHLDYITGSLALMDRWIVKVQIHYKAVTCVPGGKAVGLQQASYDGAKRLWLGILMSYTLYGYIPT